MNNRVFPIFSAFLILALLGGGLGLLFGPRPPQAVDASLVGAPVQASTDFARVEGPLALTFPADHGPHPDYQTEWWYYTGNLQSADGRSFGYQLTFFRRAIQPVQDRVQRTSHWAAEQVYLAHFTLTDVTAQQFHAFERVERGAAGLAGASSDPAYRVWLRDWWVEQTAADQYRLHAAQDGLSVDLDLTDLSGNILQGDQGYSRKGPEPGNASVYYSQPRLRAQGSVSVGGALYAVIGLSWLDREFGTSALGKDQVGWDWFSLQFDDGSEIMAYLLRRADGSIDPYSYGVLIGADGSQTLLGPDDLVIKPAGQWSSPHSQATYPSGWSLQAPSVGVSLSIEPLLKDQELNLSFTYWEGAVRVQGSRNGRALTGYGYVELTGYAGSLAGNF